MASIPKIVIPMSELVWTEEEVKAIWAKEYDMMCLKVNYKFIS